MGRAGGAHPAAALRAGFMAGTAGYLTKARWHESIAVGTLYRTAWRPPSILLVGFWAIHLLPGRSERLVRKGATYLGWWTAARAGQGWEPV